MSLRDAQNPDYNSSPELFRLAAGAHTLKITHREDGTKLDRLLITNEPEFTGPATGSVAETIDFGEAEIDHNWTRISFAKPFLNPVVVAGPISLNGGHPAVVRIQNVDESGFEMRIQEWDYLDGAHTIERVSYLVMEEGNYTLEDGTKIEAAVVTTDDAASFQPIAFTAVFSVAPVVMTSISSFNDPDSVTGRMRSITTDGFEYRMQEQESNPKEHALETLSYIAWEPSAGEVGDVTYVVGKTADQVRHKNYTIQFAQSFASSPAFIADMQTFDGGDTANVRWANKAESFVDVLIDEEQSRDSEINHTKEVVGYMVFDR